MVGGLRIKTITNNDGITAKNKVTSYDYTTTDYGGIKSTGILYSRPAYVQTLRNEIYKQVGYGNPSGYNCSPNGCAACEIGSGLPYYKSGGSVRPMATTQGYHIGYMQVMETQTGNGKSIYKYYGTNNLTTPWVQTGDVAVLKVKTTICYPSIPTFPSLPLPFEFIRGELKYESSFDETGRILKEKTYEPIFVENSIGTLGFIASRLPDGYGEQFWGTIYELKTAKKVQTNTTEKIYDINGNILVSTSSNFYESPYHNQITRVINTNSKGVTLEKKIKYTFDFRTTACNSISDCSQTYLTSVANATAIFNGTQYCVTPTGAAAACRYLAFQQYRRDISLARIAYVSCRKSNFTNPINAFKTAHDIAKTNADAELKPILELQDNFRNPSIETSNWKNGNLLGADFFRYDYSTMPVGKVYINKLQSIKLATPNLLFNPVVVNTANNSIVKDSRYQDETFVKYYNGNLSEIIGKD